MPSGITASTARVRGLEATGVETPSASVCLGKLIRRWVTPVDSDSTCDRPMAQQAA
jgi:hypothetical protein